MEVHQNKKTNDTLYILTIITGMMIPVQFLTGVYGRPAHRFLAHHVIGYHLTQ